MPDEYDIDSCADCWHDIEFHKEDGCVASIASDCPCCSDDCRCEGFVRNPHICQNAQI